MSNLVFYAPNTFETVLDEIATGLGSNIPVFKETEVTSADVLFDGTGFSKALVFSGSLSSSTTDDFFYYRRPGTLLNNGINGDYQYVQHPIDNKLYRHIPIHSLVGVEPLPSLGRVLDVSIITTSSNWIKVSGNSIVDFSPSIKQSIERWKTQNKNKVITNNSFFGAKPLAFPITPTGGLYSRSNAFEVDLVNKTITGNTSNYTFFVLGTLDNLIANPVISVPELYGNYLVQDRGLTEYGVAPDKPVEAAPTGSITFVDNSLIKGSSNRPGWYVTLTLASLGLSATVKTGPDGSWFYRLSTDEKTYLEENQVQLSSYTSQIKITVHKEQDSFTTQVAEETDPDVVKINGIPKYVLIKGDNRFVSDLSGESSNYVTNSPPTQASYCVSTKTSFYKYNKDYYKDKQGNIPLLDIIKRSSTVNEDINKIYLGTYIGIGPEDENKFFVSYPNSIIKSCGIDVFIKIVERSYSDAVSAEPLFPLNFINTYRQALSITAGVYGAEDESESIRINWGRDKFETENQRYRLRWRKGTPDNQETYSLKWSNGYEPRAYSDNYRLKWSKENSRTVGDQYLVRWSSDLPELDEDKMFFDMSWSRESTVDETIRYTFKYGVEMTKTMRDNYFISWNKDSLEDVLVKIFCIKDKERYHISYTVYGSERVSKYLLEDTLTFYFSNPSKYELIKFNRDAEPYKDIFMEEYKDEKALASRVSIPENYILIGNYTIKDIDPKNSLSLDIVAEGIQLNEFSSYWLPENMDDLEALYVPMKNKMLAAPIEPIFRDDHHIDAVELEVEFVNEVECCFKQKSIGSRCSPY